MVFLGWLSKVGSFGRGFRTQIVLCLLKKGFEPQPIYEQAYRFQNDTELPGTCVKDNRKVLRLSKTDVDLTRVRCLVGHDVAVTSYGYILLLQGHHKE